MKLYTEEQVREAMQESRYAFSTEKGYNEILNSLTPIELPSDEEEEQNAFSLTQNIQQHIGFNMGAKWMKEQILNQKKETYGTTDSSRMVGRTIKNFCNS